MFGKRAIRISLSPKPRKETLDDNAQSGHTLEEVAQISQEWITTTAVTIGGVYVAAHVAKTVCKIAETIVKANVR